jgi:hypothetical protein
LSSALNKYYGHWTCSVEKIRKCMVPRLVAQAGSQ